MVSAYVRYVQGEVSSGNNWAFALQTRCVDAALDSAHVGNILDAKRSLIMAGDAF